MRVFTVAALAAVVLVSEAVSGQQQAPPPRFEATVEIVPVDVAVLDGRGRPVPGLGPSDFTVHIDDKVRRVLSAEYVPLSGRVAPGVGAPVAEGFSSNEQAPGGRLIVIAVDQPNIPFTDMRPLQDAVNRFIEHLAPSDRVALIGFGTAAPSVSFTADRERVKQALARMPGQQQASGRDQHPMGLSTALAIDRRDGRALAQIMARDCARLRLPAGLCESSIQSAAATIVENARADGDATLRSLRELLTKLAPVDAPKTLVLISGGFFTDPDSGGMQRVVELGSLAALARTSIYALEIEEQQLDITQSVAPMVTPSQDRRERRAGLESLTMAARGALFSLTGPGTGVFDRLESELSGYYLLGVAPDARDRDGRPHPIRVNVARQGVTIRARRTIVAAGRETSASPRDRLTAAIGSPLLMTALPLQAIAFALRGTDQSKVQLLIHADVGDGYTKSQRVTVAVAILDAQGRTVDGQLSEAQLTPLAPGVPSPLALTTGGSVEPGEYTVKLAVADGDRVGSVEVPVHAALVDAGALELTELMAGGPVPPGDLLRPTVGSRVSFGSVHGYLEAYGADGGALDVAFEIASDVNGPALLRDDVAPRPAGDDRTLFSHLMRVQSLPDGAYVLRARATAGGRPVKTLTRAFDIGPPRHAVAAEVSDLFLPVELDMLARPFRREQALGPSTLQAFRDRVPAATRDSFEQGVTHLQNARFADAGTSFRDAIRPGIDTSAALTYLAVCLAAAGHDPEAVVIWRQAHDTGGLGLPQIHEWLGDAMMRTRDFSQARSMLEEAVRLWPSDVRFARPLALVYAISGRGRDAVRSMERFVRDNPADLDALFLSLEWLFDLRRAGLVVHSVAEDVALARSHRDLYARGNGPNQPLASLWMDYLARH